jgi:hypothetical protein
MESVTWFLCLILAMSLGVFIVLGPKSAITDEEILADLKWANRSQPQVGGGSQLPDFSTASLPPSASATSGQAASGPRPDKSKTRSDAKKNGDNQPPKDPKPILPEGRSLRGNTRVVAIGGGNSAGDVQYAPTIIVPESLVRRYTNFQEAYQLAHEAASEMLDDGTVLLYDIQPGSLLETVVGLRSNDRVISINGRAVPGNFSNAKSMFGDLRHETSFEVLIERGGQRTLLSFQRQGR